MLCRNVLEKGYTQSHVPWLAPVTRAMSLSEVILTEVEIDRV
jgi:hypothetical protein